MSLNLACVGTTTSPKIVSWNSTQTLLYALGVGAGQVDASAELAFTTENSEGHPQRVLPTFGVIAAHFLSGQWVDIGDYDKAMLVHAEQRLELRGELPAAGEMEVVTRVDGIYDKGSGALVATTASGRDPATGTELLRSRASYFIRGAGGFGIPGPKQIWERPEREPERKLLVHVRDDQALLYRLSGDRNPLHSDPAFAARAGFPRPILHGLCSYGIVGRLLLGAYCDGEPGRFRMLDCRFTAPAYPGDRLSVEVWEGDGEHRFIVRRNGEEVVLDRGVFGFVN